ncbi:MAG: hypothetical protein ACLRWP_20870 [Bilophila wadsworthia]
MPGDIVIIAGMDDVAIGDTICTRKHPRAPRLRVDEPTVAMRFTINASPLAGREGKNVQSPRSATACSRKPSSTWPSRLRAHEKDSFIVKGRGEFQMAILIETMRREDLNSAWAAPKSSSSGTRTGSSLSPSNSFTLIATKTSWAS